MSTEVPAPRARPAPTRRIVAAAVGIAVIVAGVVVVQSTPGIFSADLHVSLTGADAGRSGELRTAFTIRNDGEFSARVERIIVRSDALGFGDVTVTKNDEIVDLPENLDEDKLLEVEILFEEYDCDAISAAVRAPKVDVRARALMPWSAKRGFSVHAASPPHSQDSGAPILEFTEHDNWLVVAAAPVCGF
ncbi:MAG: hypothetical protein ACT4OX_09440 [Actinomycetota bacterium]